MWEENHESGNICIFGSFKNQRWKTKIFLWQCDSDDDAYHVLSFTHNSRPDEQYTLSRLNTTSHNHRTAIG